MFSALVTNAIEDIAVIEKFLTFNEEKINSEQTADRNKMKIYSASSCLTSLYSVFEHFIISSISDYLDIIPELLPYNELESEFKNEYRRGISHILNKIDSHRYNHLSHENIIRWYHDALFNNSPYQFVTEALTQHDSNLRFEVIQSLFSRIQLKDIDGWLANSPHVTFLYSEEDSPRFEMLKTELRNFIHSRNEAAHGQHNNLEDFDQLLRYCEFTKGIIRAVGSYLHKNLLLKKFECNKMKMIGNVSEVFNGNGAFIVKLAIGEELNVGQTIHLVGNYYCYSTKINSLQLDDEDVPLVLSNSEDYEVGVKCNLQAKKNSDIYISL